MAEKKLATLQEEIKLLKGEIKQTLGSVRDYLLNMELPSSEIASILSSLGNEGVQNITMRGSFDMPHESPPPAAAPPDEALPEAAPEPGAEDELPQSEILGSEAPVSERDDGELPMMDDYTPPARAAGGPPDPYEENEEPLPEDDYATDYPEDDEVSTEIEEDDESFMEIEDEEEPTAEFEDDEEMVTEVEDEEEELPFETGPEDDEGEPLHMDNYRGNESDLLRSIPKVNMMANLINWVSRAIRDIGYEQLPVFLEVYGVSGHLSPEMKDVILHLAELSSDKTEVETSAGVWSEQMLSLHGILTGGETPLHPVIPSLNAPGDISDEIESGEIMDGEEPEEAPVKLKLVFPNASGEQREYSIDLAPEAFGDAAAKAAKQQP